MYLRLILLALLSTTLPLSAQIDSQYLTQNLNPTTPRLLLTPTRLDSLRTAIATDDHMAAYYAGVKAQADRLLQRQPLRRKMTGRRLLSVSREALNRNGILAVTYLMEGDRRYLDRLGEELSAVSAFTDWNPSHFLDVAEMMLAVSLALDWCGDELPVSISTPAYTALLEKGLRPAMDSSHWWIDTDNNWNQVCHVGTISAALTLAEREPTLAAAAIDRALVNLPHSMATYAPDGAYPEGPGYWGYATFYVIMGSEMLETALGTDFGLAASPGFVESAKYLTLMRSPSGRYYNYGDNREGTASAGAELLSWFAARTGQTAYYRPEYLGERYRDNTNSFSRFAAPALVWTMMVDTSKSTPLPLSWAGGGTNPVFVLRDSLEESFYLAGKGGRGSINHGNMDAGSFIFELDGVRWSVDLGVQRYHDLEKRGFDLWGREQHAPRWTLLSKNNYGHSTLTVNDSLHRVGGFATIEPDGDRTFTMNMDEVFTGQLPAARRTFEQTGRRSFTVTDSLKLSAATQIVTWQMLTQADVTLTNYGAQLRQDGKTLHLYVDRPARASFTVVPLDPPPLAYDIEVPGLKRIELRLPTDDLPEETVIKVRLTGE